MPQLWVVAGPNGAGKTTLVSHRLRHRVPVINPDAIAEQLPRRDGRLDERQAGEIAVRRRAELIGKGADFAVETTMAGHGTLRLVARAGQAGYKVTLVYIGLASATLSTQRVLDRVRRGGHAVSVDAVERRYSASLANLPRAVELADRSYLFDNSEQRRRLLAICEDRRIRYVAHGLPGWLPPRVLVSSDANEPF